MRSNSQVATIRRGRPDDAAAYCKCVAAVAQERKYLVTVEGFSLEETRSFLQAIEARGSPCTVATADGVLIGWCDIIPKTARGFTHVGTLGVGLAWEFRGQGIGRRLLIECLSQAREIGLERIELVVYSDNPRAIHLYESLGFLHEGRKVQARKIDGYHQDELLMALRFQVAPGASWPSK